MGNTPGPKTKSALIKALQIELNNQYNKKLVVDGKWGPKTIAAIVTVKKGAKGNLTWILQAALYTEGYSPGSLDSIFGKGNETALAKFQKARDISVDRKGVKLLSLNCLLDKANFNFSSKDINRFLDDSFLK